MNDLHKILKDMSRFVCLELCCRYLEHKECQKCEFWKLINKLVKYYNKSG